MVGKGILSIAQWTGAVIGSYTDVGNCPRFEFELTESALEHFSSRSGTKEQDMEIVVQTGYTVNFTLDEVSVENMRMFMKGSLSGTRIIYANQNTSTFHALRFESDNPYGPNYKVEFWKCKLTPNGAFSLIGDDWTSMAFTGKGLSDRAGHATSPFFTLTFDTSTTTTTTTAV
jgi:hypothetical protein